MGPLPFRTLIEALFSRPVVALAERPGLTAGDVFEAEQAHVARAVEKRRAEFLTARVLARRALAELSIAAGPLVPAEDRSPVWPAGAVGSISHTQGLCVVVVARSGDVESVGLDVERSDPLEPALLRKICTEEELAFLAGHSEERQTRLGKLYFSAKEAFYKCQHPLTRTYLGFHDVTAHLDLENGTFQCRVSEKTGPHRERLQATVGRFSWMDPFIFAGATLER